MDEMKRISAHGEKKLKLRRASIARVTATNPVEGPPAVVDGASVDKGDQEVQLDDDGVGARQ